MWLSQPTPWQSASTNTVSDGELVRVSCSSSTVFTQSVPACLFMLKEHIIHLLWSLGGGGGIALYQSHLYCTCNSLASQLYPAISMYLWTWVPQDINKIFEKLYQGRKIFWGELLNIITYGYTFISFTLPSNLILLSLSLFLFQSTLNKPTFWFSRSWAFSPRCGFFFLF